MRHLPHLVWATFVWGLVALPAGAQAPSQPPPDAQSSIGTLEAIGAQRCGGDRASIQVEFMAPEEASLVANAAISGTQLSAQSTATLALDGKDCGGDTCSFRAVKGQRYRLTATRLAGRSGDLCVSVTRP